MERLYSISLIFWVSLAFFSCRTGESGFDQGTLKEFTRSEIKMGSAFAITAVSSDSVLAFQCIDKAYREIDRIEKMISSWNPDSETSLINVNAGIKPIKVSEELFLLIERALKVSDLTNGAFDISYASMDRIWKFDGSMIAFPEKEAIEKSVEKVNYREVVLDNNSRTVFLRNEGMKIGFGGIGKGYAANRAKSVLLDAGIENGVVNAGGDLIAWGKKANQKSWDIAIADPKSPDKLMSWLEINDMAVVTSGNYERFAVIDGVRYSHIINPKTGIPVTGLKSVTILCPDAELADAVATGVFVMGKAAGLDLINQLKGIEALLISDENEVFSSKGLSLNYYEK